jgi:hypothetical protein
MGVKYDFLMVILVEFDTNIIEIGPPGLILWEKYYLMAAILENGRQWPPYWIFQAANALFVISSPTVTCITLRELLYRRDGLYWSNVLSV